MNSTRRFLSCAAFAALVALLSPLGEWVQAAAIPAPNPMPVVYGGVTLGSLNIAQYDKDSGGNPAGAHLLAQFTKSPNCNCSLKWIQAITDGKGTIGQADGTAPPYLDPYGGGPADMNGKPTREDNLPWYWTDPENMSPNTLNPDSSIKTYGGVFGTNGPGSQFFDGPSQDFRNSGNFIKFETALVAVQGLNVFWLKGFTWGYKINADMTSTEDPFAWLNAPTASLTGPLTAWDGSLNPKNPGAAAGYKFVNGALNCAPEPSSIVLCLLGSVGLAAGASRKRRRVAA
jgi:hypothetical protein